jgi:hypothetical protein
MEQIIAVITFKGSDILKVAQASKKCMRLVHDDGTYILPDVTNRPLIRPISGEIEGGDGDDFCQNVALPPKNAAITKVTYTLTETTIQTKWSVLGGDKHGKMS